MLFFKRKKQNQDLDASVPAFGLPDQPTHNGSPFSTQDFGSPVGQTGSGPFSSAQPTPGGPAPKPIDIIRDPNFVSENGMSQASQANTAGDLGAGTLTNISQQYDVGGTMVSPPVPTSPSATTVNRDYDIGGDISMHGNTIPDSVAVGPVADTNPKTPQADTIPDSVAVGSVADTNPKTPVDEVAATVAPPADTDITKQYDVGGSMVTPPVAEQAQADQAQTTTSSSTTSTPTDITKQYDVGGSMVTPPSAEQDKAAPAPAPAAPADIPRQYDVGGSMVTPPAGPALPDTPHSDKSDLEPATDYLSPAHHPGKVMFD